MKKARTMVAAAMLGLATIIAGPSAAAGAPPPSLAAEWARCRAQFSAPVAAPADRSYTGGISAQAGALTPPSIPGVTTVSVRQAQCLMDHMGKELVVAAVYSAGEAVPYSYAMPLPGVTRANLTEAEKSLVHGQLVEVAGGQLDRPVLVYCHHESCMLSHNAAIRLVEAGYKNVFWMREGIDGWKAAGLPVAKLAGPGEPARDPVELRAIPRREPLPLGYLDYPQPASLLTSQGDKLSLGGKTYRTGRLCLMLQGDIRKQRDETSFPGSRPIYRWQAYLYQMAGVDPRVDNDVVERQKMQAFWREHGEGIHCSVDIASRATLLSYALLRGDGEFAELYLHDWGLPVNAVDYSDGFTITDALINKASELKPEADEDKAAYAYLVYWYNRVRSLGGLPRLEAEAAGLIPTERQLQAKYIKDYEALARAGNHRASYQLAWIYTQGEHADVNLSEANRWWALMEQQAIQANDYAFMAQTIGYAYMSWENRDGVRERKRMRPVDNATAVQWYKRAAEARDKEGMFFYGRALAYGWDGRRDEAAGIFWLGEALRAGEDIAAIRLFDIYLARGDVANAAIYGRSVHPLAFGAEGLSDVLDRDDSIKAYFKRKGLSWCGARAPGLDPRPPNEC